MKAQSGKPPSDDPSHELDRLVSELWNDPETRAHIQAAHEEVRAGKVVRVKGALTVKRLARLGRKLDTQGTRRR